MLELNHLPNIIFIFNGCTCSKIIYRNHLYSSSMSTMRLGDKCLYQRKIRMIATTIRYRISIIFGFSVDRFSYVPASSKHLSLFYYSLINSFGECVITSLPESVMIISSSIRQPPILATYIPGSTVTTIFFCKDRKSVGEG